MLRGVVLAGLLALAACAGRSTACRSPALTVANRSGLAIEQLYLAPSAAEEEADLLGPLPLRPGEERRFPLPRPATASRLRVVWVDGRAAEIARFDVCATPRVTVLDSSLQPGPAR
jgi:hypothetical protein